METLHAIDCPTGALCFCGVDAMVRPKALPRPKMVRITARPLETDKRAEVSRVRIRPS